MNGDKLQKVKNSKGFIAALDQSGGSTPKALAAYGVSEDQYHNEDEMFELIHQMRSRIMTSPVFTGERILGAILFEKTMDSQVEGVPTVDYLWNVKNIATFLKIDKGLADENNNVQMMKPIDGLVETLQKAVSGGVFGTKMRSVINEANEQGIVDVVNQQFEFARQISDAGLVPIVEPEVNIHSTSKSAAEAILKREIQQHLDQLDDSHRVMLKLTLPDEDNFYSDFVTHPKVVRVVALSGGYSRDDANAKLRSNNGIVASFSRALTEGLSAQQNDQEFDNTLDATIESIYQASIS
jgi:fructose-bisphosphate aldolase class I